MDDRICFLSPCGVFYNACDFVMFCIFLHDFKYFNTYLHDFSLDRERVLRYNNVVFI